jgi:hypothetical protein
LCKDYKESDPGIGRGQCISEELAAAVHPKLKLPGKGIVARRKYLCRARYSTRDDSTIICEDVDVQKAAQALTMGALLNAGQVWNFEVSISETI